MPRFIGEADPNPDEVPATGVLLANTGSPAAPTPWAVRRYLARFLADPRVVEAPRIPWWLLLHGVILNVRPFRSARLYGEVWTPEGAPLLAVARRQAKALTERLSQSAQILVGGPIEVALGMAYGTPSIGGALEDLRRRRCRRILVLPLFPQYSGVTAGSVFDAVAAALTRWRRVPELRFIADYHDDPGYIRAVAAGIRRFWRQEGEPDRLLI
ncbi:MAG: ferrochelatase, partial [bacterium]|nr:ferrochelatase [bacterium]